MKEWENNGSGVVGSDLGDMFEAPQEMVIERMQMLQNQSLDLEYLSTENKHTNSRTGTAILLDC